MWRRRPSVHFCGLRMATEASVGFSLKLEWKFRKTLWTKRSFMQICSVTDTLGISTHAGLLLWTIRVKCAVGSFRAVPTMRLWSQWLSSHWKGLLCVNEEFPPTFYIIYTIWVKPDIHEDTSSDCECSEDRRWWTPHFTEGRKWISVRTFQIYCPILIKFGVRDLLAILLSVFELGNIRAQGRLWFCGLREGCDFVGIGKALILWAQGRLWFCGHREGSDFVVVGKAVILWAQGMAVVFWA